MTNNICFIHHEQAVPIVQSLFEIKNSVVDNNIIVIANAFRAMKNQPPIRLTRAPEQPVDEAVPVHQEQMEEAIRPPQIVSEQTINTEDMERRKAAAMLRKKLASDERSSCMQSWVISGASVGAFGGGTVGAFTFGGLPGTAGGIVVGGALGATAGGIAAHLNTLDQLNTMLTASNEIEEIAQAALNVLKFQEQQRKEEDRRATELRAQAELARRAHDLQEQREAAQIAEAMQMKNNPEFQAWVQGAILADIYEIYVKTFELNPLKLDDGLFKFDLRGKANIISQIDKAKTNCDTLDIQIDDANKSVQANKQSTAELERKLKAKENDIFSLKQDIAEIELKISKLKPTSTFAPNEESYDAPDYADAGLSPEEAARKKQSAVSAYLRKNAEIGNELMRTKMLLEENLSSKGTEKDKLSEEIRSYRDKLPSLLFIQEELTAKKQDSETLIHHLETAAEVLVRKVIRPQDLLTDIAFVNSLFRKVVPQNNEKLFTEENAVEKLKKILHRDMDNKGLLEDFDVADSCKIVAKKVAENQRPLRERIHAVPTRLMRAQ